jgi:transposase
MGCAYSMDLRQRVMDHVAAGETCHRVAAALKVAPSSLIKRAQRRRRTGSFAPDKMGGRRPALITGEHRGWVLSMIDGPEHVKLAWLARGLGERGLKVHPTNICRFLHREGKSFKKAVLPAEQSKPKLARQRELWRRHQGKIDPDRLVFVDETWVNQYGSAQGLGRSGQAIGRSCPHGHWKTMTFVAALRSDRVDARWVLNGPINANAFLTYIEKGLARTLSPGDIVVLDNPGSHKGRAVRRAIRSKADLSATLPPRS